MRIGIVGAGGIGRKRSESLGKNELVAIADINIDRARFIACDDQIKIFSDWKELVKLSELDVIIVSTINSMLAPIALGAIQAGKHVLIEKPCACNVEDIDGLIKAKNKNNVLVKVGYTLRSHPALIKAKELVQSGTIGELMFIKGHYGNGARLGFEKEWRANPEYGGGVLQDLGVHLIDLAQYFLGYFTKISGSTKTYFWDIPVEDNVFMNLETKDGKTAFLSASFTEWKNTFSFEIYGTKGKIKIEGLNNSFGTEILKLYEMLPSMGLPITSAWEFYNDNSLIVDLETFIVNINDNVVSHPNLEDAREVMRVVMAIYLDVKNYNCGEKL